MGLGNNGWLRKGQHWVVYSTGSDKGVEEEEYNFVNVMSSNMHDKNEPRMITTGSSWDFENGQ